VSRPVAPYKIHFNHEDFLLHPVFFATAGLIATLFVLLSRKNKDFQELLAYIKSDRGRIDPATRILVELLSDIANASAQSGESQYLLAKRLNNILISPRGEGRIIKESFMVLANLYDSGLLSELVRECPELSHNELILCGMITVGLNPVCISKILGYDHEHTFYNKRADVRKKLRLSHTVPLEGYLSERAQSLRKEHEAYLRKLIARN
jgi:DNA-binding CsgD family transcriptional regulator